jgi:hypothetical protein
VLDYCIDRHELQKEVEKQFTKELFLTTFMDRLEAELKQFEVEVSALKEYTAKLLIRKCANEYHKSNVDITKITFATISASRIMNYYHHTDERIQVETMPRLRETISEEANRPRGYVPVKYIFRMAIDDAINTFIEQQ